MFRARDLGLGFRLGVGRQGTIHLLPVGSARGVCVCVCVFVRAHAHVRGCMSYRSITSLHCIVSACLLSCSVGTV